MNLQRQAEIEHDLRRALFHFTGSDTFIQHWTGCFAYTEAVKYLTEIAKCHWLIDAIASYQTALSKDPLLRQFQVWYLLRPQQGVIPWMQVEGPNAAVLACWPDIPQQATQPSIRQDIGFTNFPLNQICLHVAGGKLYFPLEK